MVEDLILFAFIIGYIIGGYYFTRFICNRIGLMNRYLKFLVMSFSYAMIFGIGMVGGGGDPGFAFPFPVILTGLIDIWTWVEINLFFTGFILPLAFWWTLIFIVMLIKERMARRNLGLKETTESLHEFKK